MNRYRLPRWLTLPLLLALLHSGMSLAHHQASPPPRVPGHSPLHHTCPPGYLCLLDGTRIPLLGHR